MLKVEEILAVYSGNLASMAGELADISSKMAAMSEVIGGLLPDTDTAGGVLYTDRDGCGATMAGTEVQGDV